MSKNLLGRSREELQHGLPLEWDHLVAGLQNRTWNLFVEHCEKNGRKSKILNCRWCYTGVCAIYMGSFQCQYCEQFLWLLMYASGMSCNKQQALSVLLYSVDHSNQRYYNFLLVPCHTTQVLIELWWQSTRALYKPCIMLLTPIPL